MSNWPPPKTPNAPYQRPIKPKQNTSGGCGRALLVSLVLSVCTIAVAVFLSGRNEDFVPVMQESVGVVRIEGPIVESGDVVKLIRKMRESSMISAIVLRLETPGGGVGASEEIYREAMKARTEDKKLVIASMGDVAASGGYYIAAATDYIFATSSTITGSIGVIAPNYNAAETIRKLGVREETIATGEHKNSGNPFNDERTTAERVMLQGVINDMYRQFFQVVLRARHEEVAKAASSEAFADVVNAAGTKAEGRGIEWSTFTTGTVAAVLGVPEASETALRRLADGRIYTGEQALKVGLVDTIGTLQDAVDFAGETVGLGVDPPVVDRKPKAEVSSWLGARVRNFVREVTASGTSIEYRSRF